MHPAPGHHHRAQKCHPDHDVDLNFIGPHHANAEPVAADHIDKAQYDGSGECQGKYSLDPEAKRIKNWFISHLFMSYMFMSHMLMSMVNPSFGRNRRILTVRDQIPISPSSDGFAYPARLLPTIVSAPMIRFLIR